METQEMKCCGESVQHQERGSGEGKIVIVGNPNVGKSVVFNLLSGSYVSVSNYPGTTVEIMRGRAKLGKRNKVILDTPGVLSFLPHSEDEVVARDVLIEERPELAVQVADTKNLGRSLFLTLQLIEMGLPLVLDLNMVDESDRQGIRVDENRLAQALGISVVKTVAIEKKGADRLRSECGRPHPASSYRVQYGAVIEDAVSQLEPILPELGISKRFQALLLLSADQSFRDSLQARGSSQETLGQIGAILHKAHQQLHENPGYYINKIRKAQIDILMQQVLRTARPKQRWFTESLGRWMMHPVWGIPFLAVVLWLMYQFVGVFGAGTCVDFLESIILGNPTTPSGGFFVGAWHVPWDGAVWYLAQGWQKWIPAWPLLQFLYDLFLGEYGLISVGLTYALAIVFPIVTTFFLTFGILEDSGYLPRLAVLTDRAFQKIGLNGKAVLPMVLGLGCDTMATLTTRILDTKKERLLATLLLALGVPCSAQLGVVMAMLGAVSWKAVAVVFGLVVGVMFIVGWLAARLVPGDRSDFILEIPPVRIPKVSNVLVKTLARLEWYLMEAVPFFLLGTFVLFVLAKLHFLTVLEHWMSPLVQGWLGLPAKASEAFIIGFLRRDYAATGLFQLERLGMLNDIQIVVSMVVITLFVPCLANVFIIIKTQGLKRAAAMVGFIFPFAFFVGGICNWVLRTFSVSLR